MDNYQCHVWIDNKTSEQLNLQSKTTPWGGFTEGPLERIARMDTTGKKAFRATGTKGAPAGVEGTVVYQVGDDAQRRITIHFDVPTSPWKDNTVECTVPQGFIGEVKGLNGSGASESCTIVVSRAS